MTHAPNEMRDEYTTINDSNIERFHRRVNELLVQGWRLHGGIAISIDARAGYSQFPTLAQALIKRHMLAERGRQEDQAAMEIDAPPGFVRRPFTKEEIAAMDAAPTPPEPREADLPLDDGTRINLEMCVKLTAAENRITQLEAALKLVACQDEGCGGNLRPEEIYRNMQKVARAALSQTANAGKEG